MVFRTCAVALGSVALAGCLVDDPNHCANREGSASCASDEFCSICEGNNNGCVASRPTNDCTPGVDQVTGTSSTTSETEPTETDPSTGPQVDCMADAMCTDEAAPFCLDGTCVPCSAVPDNPCQDPTPACVGGPEEAGICVACDNDAACGDPEVGCTDGYTCEGCTEHNQCPSGACDIFEGTCFAQGLVRQVDNGASNCLQMPPVEGNGVDSPFCSLTVAIDSIPFQESGVLIVQGTTIPYDDTRSVTEDRIMAIIGRQNPIIRDDTTAMGSISRSRTYFSGLQIENATNAAVRCSSKGRLYIDDCEIANNRIGIETNDCRLLQLRRSRVHSNLEEGVVALGGGNLSLRSSAITNNGQGGADGNAGRGVRLGNTSFDIVYTTIAENLSAPTTEDGGTSPTNLECTGTTSGTVRNSIVAGTRGGTVNCQVAQFNHSVIDTAIAGLPEDVVVLGQDGVQDLNPGWFDDLQAGLVRLTAPNGTPFVGVAQWQLGDPRTDIEGQVRAPLPGTAEFVGADQP